MKPLSILTAILVAATLYGVVFERDRLMDFAGRGAQDAPAEAAEQTTPPDEKSSADGPVKVVAIESKAQSIDNTVSLRGETAASRRVDVQSETSGRIISEPIEKGTAVQAGDLLCRIDPGTRPAQLAEAEARLAEAQITDTAAERLAEGGFASETRAVGARATLQAAQAAVNAAKIEIGRLEITAPFAGIIEEETAELGSLMQPGTLCATIMLLDPIRIVAYVPETLVAAIDPGAAAQIRLPDGKSFAARVSFVANSADPETRTFRVELTAPNPHGAIRDGQSAAVSIEAAGIAAHLIPASALTLDDDGTMGLRLVEADDTVHFQPVQLVRDTQEGVLLTGLPDTARVIVVGQEFVREGVTVDVTLREPGA